VVQEDGATIPLDQLFPDELRVDETTASG
jgi:hypothetical protein